MKHVFGVMAAGLVVSSAWAAPSETQDFINQQVSVGESVREHAPALNFSPAPAAPLSAQDGAWLESLKQRRQQMQAGSGEEKPVPKALYFVSFSIPPEGVKTLIEDAARFGVPATLRGLINNDFRQTATAIFDLVKEDKRGGVQVDPTAFTTYGIKAVPALVVICPGTYDRVSGNIRLAQALKKVAEEGECAEVAKNLLKAAGEE
ncbi:type-F conjugative transfer system pilin assembly protein TrbC [Chimaeribacter arupi]|uniref:type-F conjugative transfer system pilin assembly protein TrbC n=1 Tax=Chimaeribacter arupi TaxID=2060066 RepID=UPI0013FCFB6C|nr:type-F conjugative transfer system pilin assembly protein TrbC [Chimaeribacter arupi]